MDRWKLPVGIAFLELCISNCSVLLSNVSFATRESNLSPLERRTVYTTI